MNILTSSDGSNIVIIIGLVVISGLTPHNITSSFEKGKQTLEIRATFWEFRKITENQNSEWEFSSPGVQMAYEALKAAFESIFGPKK